MRRVGLSVVALFSLLTVASCQDFALGWPLTTGWAVGNTVGEPQSRPVILHTRDGGQRWTLQEDGSEWPGYDAFDVSAVDARTAWVALSSEHREHGAILHTSNGGESWEAQTLPEGLDAIKAVKGLSRSEAWAASLTGTLLHTTDGGHSWQTVPHPTAAILQVNRMDAIGCRSGRSASGPLRTEPLINANIWIVDHQGGNLGMIHSLYNGALWRQEYVPYTGFSTGMHMVSAYSPRVVWSAAWADGTLFRTLDGGESWEAVAVVGGPNDLDDMCSPAEDRVWAVQNQSGASSGAVFHVQVGEDGTPEISEFNPVPGYAYEGMTCAGKGAALVVGFRGEGVDPSEPEGVIVSTSDGGQTWHRHSAPIQDVSVWKTSFAGARR
jgi:photosystem II stability/assembly factor-like uncharacterized protein